MTATIIPFTVQVQSGHTTDVSFLNQMPKFMQCLFSDPYLGSLYAILEKEIYIFFGVLKIMAYLGINSHFWLFMPDFAYKFVQQNTCFFCTPI